MVFVLGRMALGFTGGCSRRRAAEVRRGCAATATAGRWGSHGGRLWALAKLQRGHSSVGRDSSRGIMVAVGAARASCGFVKVSGRVIRLRASGTGPAYAGEGQGREVGET